MVFITGTGSAPVVGASTINQDVANLVADGKIAEQVEERQIDNLEKEVLYQHYLGLVATKHVFGIFDKPRPIPVSSDTETS